MIIKYLIKLLLKILPKKQKTKFQNTFLDIVMVDNSDLFIRQLLEGIDKQPIGELKDWDKYVKELDKDLEMYPKLKPYRQVIYNRAFNTRQRLLNGDC